MKANHNILALLVSILSLISYGQTEIDPNLLIRTWILDHTASIEHMEPSGVQRWEAMPAERRERILKAYQGRRLQFGADGLYMLSMKNGKKSLGIWVYLPESNSIEVTHNNGKVSFQRIKSLDGDRLVLKPESENNRPLLIPELHYTKN